MSETPMAVTVSLRAKAVHGDLSFLATTLSLPVLAKWQAGEARITPKGTVLSGNRAESYISLQLYPTKRSWLCDAITDCLALLEEHRADIDDIRSSGADLELFVGWFLDRSGGDSLTPEIMRRLADLGISLSLDVYPSSDDVSPD